MPSDALNSVPHTSSVRSSLGEAVSWFGWLSLFLIVLPASLFFLPALAVLSALTILASVWLMQTLVGVFNLRRITIPAFFYYLYFAVILLPGFFIFSDEVTPTRWRFLFGIESVLITVPIGIAIANLLFRFNRKRIAIFFDSPVDVEAPGSSALRVYVILMALGLIFVLINILETPVIPLFYIIRNPGEFLTAAVLREDAFKLLDSHFTYVYSVLRGTIFPILILVAFGRYRLQHLRQWRWPFWISLAIGIFYGSLTLEKSPVAAIFGLLFLFYYLFRAGRVGRTASIFAPFLFICFPLAVVLLAYHGSEGGTLGAAIQALGTRLFYSPAQIVYAYFEVFPNVIPFQHGATITKLAATFGWTSVDIPNAVGMYMNTGTDLSTITANGCFIGNLNADFGLPGVVLGGILAGFFMQAVSIHFCVRAKTVANLAAHTICMWAFGLLVTTGLPTTLLSGGVTFALILAPLLGRPGRTVLRLGADSLPVLADGTS
jgi:hypothetical protein